MARNERNRTLEDVDIAFRNFAGKEDMYNREGSRNFAIFLDPETADSMLRDGWNVRYLREREEGDGQQAYIQVAVSFKTRPPKIVLVTSKNMTYLDEDLLDQLDWVDIETADVTINPYDWNVNGKAGTKAYLQALYVKIEEDYLMEKWKAFIEDNKAEQRELAAAEPIIIDGEYELN